MLSQKSPITLAWSPTLKLSYRLVVLPQVTKSKLPNCSYIVIEHKYTKTSNYSLIRRVIPPNYPDHWAILLVFVSEPVSHVWGLIMEIHLGYPESSADKFPLLHKTNNRQVQAVWPAERQLLDHERQITHCSCH